MNPLNPTPALLVKLGSIVVHLEEFFSPNGHPVDERAIQSLLTDLEVRAWLDDMDRLCLLPLKRVA